MTCEYATGAVGAACIACALWFLESDGGFFSSLIESIIAAVRDVAVLVPSMPLPPLPPPFV